MAITAIKGARGKQQAFCACDVCGAEKTINARHSDNNRQVRSGREGLTLRSEESVIAALSKDGWAIIKGKLRCRACEAKRAEREQAEMGKKEMDVKLKTGSELRQPTREMRRDIQEMLTAVYDMKAGIYKGSETDVTVADAVGDGCLFGWVTEERERAYGLSGENEEMRRAGPDLSAIEGRITGAIEGALNARKAVKDYCDDIVGKLSADVATLTALKSEVAAAKGRVLAIAKSVGGRVTQ